MKSRASWLTAGLVLADFAIGLCAFVFAFDIDLTSVPDVRSGHFLQFAVMAAVAVATVPLLIGRTGLYGSQRIERLGSMVARVLTAGSLATASLAGLAMVFGYSYWVRPAAIAGLATMGGVAGLRLVLFTGLHVLRRSGRNYRDVVVVGTGPRARQFASEVASHPAWGLRVIAHVDDAEEAGFHPEHVEFHKLVDFPDLLRSQVVDEVVIALPRGMLTQVEPVVSACAVQGIPVVLLSDMFGDYLPAPQPVQYGPLRALSFARAPHTRTDEILKRAIDIVGGLVLLALSAPLIAVSAVLVRLTTPGPAFFRQTRCGRNGRTFQMVKLRSMVYDAEAQLDDLEEFNEMSGPIFKISDDPRVTTVGWYLRRFSIDETPQFWSVVKGDMSLVGPRPPLPREVKKYQPSDRRRLSVRPGITCLWQISGRNEIGFDDWVKLDLQYIDDWSIGLDIWILAQTVVAVVRGRGAS